ncbi:MAG: helix-turn-helix transcriptional regulator, partial [Firmicutes bacterium]|nr:helix-turn-helix transcriptional regulator [Bacillota bacterium]
MSFGESLSRLRRARGLNQEDLAAQVQVSRQAISKWENDDAMPDLPKLLAVADALEISLDELCGREAYAAAPAAAAEPAAPPAAPPQQRHALRPVLRFVLALALGFVLAMVLGMGG